MNWRIALLVALGCSGDGTTDSDCVTLVFTDADGDFFGDPSSEHVSCDGLPNEVPDGTDCDDADGDVYPEAPEQCNDRDDNCNDEIDEELPIIFFHPDLDGDGYGAKFVNIQACVQPPDATTDDSDCDDENPQINILALEICDEIDNDCDARIDDEDSSLDKTTATGWYADVDGDGYGTNDNVVVSCLDPNPGNTVTVGGDCDDGRDLVSPDGLEICNGLDDDCDGLENDLDPSVDPASQFTWYADVDRDGFGDSATAQLACARPFQTVSIGGDCDDNNPLIGGGCG